MALFQGDDGDQERTEAPTPKRREEARKEGRVPRSQELSAAATLLAAAGMLAFAGGQQMGDETTRLLVDGTRWLGSEPLTVGAATLMIRTAAGTLFRAMLPLALALVTLSLLVGLVQSRGVLSAEPLSPKLSHLDPLAGIGRLLSAQAPFTLVKSVLKIVTLGVVSYLALKHAWPTVTALSEAHPREVLEVVRRLALRLALSMGLAFLALSLADYGFEVWRYEKGLRMTKQEIIQEHKETDGNPLVKHRIRSLAQAMARKRMLGDVKQADVVVTNPTHIAVALRYDIAESAAPTVLAMGERKLAERIKLLAKESGIPLVENKPLARALFATAKVGRPIPADLYAAVAEVLAFVYRRRGWRLA